MPDPQDAIPDPVARSEYWTGYYAGKAAAMENLGVVYRTHLDLSRRRSRPGKWATVTFWSLITVVAADQLVTYLAGDYSRWDAFNNGVMLTLVLMRVTRLRYPR